MPGASVAPLHGGRVRRDEQVTTIENEHHVDHEPLATVGEWLELCDIDLDRNEIGWPLQKLNELPDLRRCPMEIDGQCIAWHIFKDDRGNNLPSYDMSVPGLNFESCRDAWYLERPVKLKRDGFARFKAHLLEERISEMRMLNVPVTEKTVRKSSQHQHSVMVRDRVQHFYDVKEDCPVEVHNPTANVTPRGTATEILCTMPRESIVMRLNSSESYIDEVIQLLRENKTCNDVCGLCQYFGRISRRDEDCWEEHDVAIRAIVDQLMGNLRTRRSNKGLDKLH